MARSSELRSRRAAATKRKSSSPRARVSPKNRAAKDQDTPPPRVEVAKKRGPRPQHRPNPQQHMQQQEPIPEPRYNSRPQQQQAQQHYPREQRRAEPQQWNLYHQTRQERILIPLIDASSGKALYRGKPLKLSRDVPCPEPYCDLSFCSLLTLDLHKNFHAKYKFTCTVCYKRFKTIDQLHSRMYHTLEFLAEEATKRLANFSPRKPQSPK